jgi:CBS domain-containing protein
MTASTHPGESPQDHRPIYTVPRGVKAHDVVRFMAARGTRAIVVLSGLRPIGIVTSRDLADRVPGGAVSETPVAVESAMSSPLVRINERGSVVEAIALMAQKGVSQLPIVSTSGFLVSVITLDEAQSLRSQGVPTLVEFVQRSVVVPMSRRDPWRRFLHEARRGYRENRMWWWLAVGLALSGAVLALAASRSWLGFQTYELKGYEPKDLPREQYLEQRRQPDQSGKDSSAR